MSIRIRVYPQYHSIGARRNRAVRRQQQLIRQSFNWQQQLLRQQMQQRVFGFGGYGGVGGYSPTQWASPAASGWGFASGAMYPGGYGSVGSAYAGAYAVPGHGYGSSYSTGYSGYSNGYSNGYSPASVAQHGSYQHGYDNC